MSLVLAIVNAWRPSFSRLQKVADFGTNPGALGMLTFLPDILSPRPEDLLCWSFSMAHYSRLRTRCRLVDTCRSIWVRSFDA